MSNIFYDNILENSITISFDAETVNINFKDGRFTGNYFREEKLRNQLFEYGYNGEGTQSISHEFSRFKFYRFMPREIFLDQRSEFLYPLYGDNLLAVILTHKELRGIVKQLFEKFGLRTVFDPPKGEIKAQKELEDVLIFFPYSTISDTLRRIIFYLTAIYSNKDSILAFEEPESHAFPYYTKYLAERIALNQNQNQYFISTHNPYFLTSILEKTPKEEVAVFLTYFEDYQTKVKPLSQKDIEDIMDRGVDAFFNIERFLE